LGETAEEELLVAGLFEPKPGSFGMHVPAPQKRQPNVRIKEIQYVHKSVCC
jgi:hypothetical protein